jgi:hypothetical protein
MVASGAATMRLHRLAPPALVPSAALALAAALLAPPQAAAQQVYKWKDAAGVTHFTAEPPPQGQHYEAREVDHHQAVPQAGDASGSGGDGTPRATREDPGCATARSNLALLDGKAQVTVDSNGDGKPDRPLSEAERANQRKLAEATIAVKCAGSAPAQAPEPEER